MNVFLDIDGVLNRHGTRDYLHPECLFWFNKLDGIVDGVVLSSAWRYEVLRGDKTLPELASFLFSLGLSDKFRIVGHTKSDKDTDVVKAPEEEPFVSRERLILDYIRLNGIGKSLVIDDLPLKFEEDDPVVFVKTGSDCGFNEKSHAECVDIIGKWGKRK